MLVHDNPERIVVFDFSNILYISYYGVGGVSNCKPCKGAGCEACNHKGEIHTKFTSDGRPNGHIYGFVDKVVGVLRRYEERDERVQLIFVFDQRSQKKRDLIPTYKSKRKHTVFDPMPDARKLARYVRSIHIECTDHEADDAIGMICHNPEVADGTPIDIITTDKDMWQLMDRSGVNVFNPITWKYVDVTDRNIKFGVNTWDKIALWKAIFGDSSDDIPASVPRLRKKITLPVINQCDGTVEAFYRHFEMCKGDFSAKENEKIVAARDLMQRHYDAVKISSDHDNAGLSIDFRVGNPKFMLSMFRRFECDEHINDVEFLSGVPYGL